MNNPLVSIIIPAYNAERYIKRAIQSALDQTYKNIEVIVVDDGSTDRTAEIVKSFKDPRVLYLYQKNQGQGRARNYAIKKSKGKYITFLDADDIYLPEKVEKEVEFLKQHPDYKIVYCHALHFFSKNPNRFYKKKGEFKSGNLLPQLLRSSLINLNTAMIARQVFDKVGLFHKQRYYPEEWELWLKIAQAGFRFGFLDQALVKVEIRKESNTSMAIQWILKEETLKMIKKAVGKMSPEERKKYEAEKILRRLKFKLAVAYLVGGKKKEFFKTISTLFSYPQKIFVLPASLLLSALPSFILKPLLATIWRARQRKTFKPIQSQ